MNRFTSNNIDVAQVDEPKISEDFESFKTSDKFINTLGGESSLNDRSFDIS